jgi:hypothetical protein
MGYARWVRLVHIMGNMRIEYSFSVKNVKEGEYLEIPELDGRIILKYISNYWDMRA